MARTKEAPRDKIACENYVIHKGALVQKGCGLIIIDPQNFAVRAVNEMLHQAFDAPTRLDQIFNAFDADMMIDSIQQTGLFSARFFRLNNGDQAWASVFENDDMLGIDLTYITDDDLNLGRDSQQFVDCVRKMSDAHEANGQNPQRHAQTYFQTVVEGVQKLTGFERVKMYQFDADMNGTVIAETRSASDVPSFLGLKFPSGDIPKPARDLFLINKVRQVINIDHDPETILATTGSQSPFIINQERSAVRYTSPIHTDYLRNMGVKSTVVVGVVVQRKLWGLISCHNCSRAVQLSPQVLNLCQVVSDIVSSHVSRRQDQVRTQASSDIRAVIADMSVQVAQAADKAEFDAVIARHKDALLGGLGADGLVFESDRSKWEIGDIPNAQDTSRLAHAAAVWRKAHDAPQIATSDVHRFCPELSADAAKLGGYAEFLTWDNRCSLRVYRAATTQQESWAGDPDAPLRYADTDENILHPRNSFRAYNLMTAGCAKPWSEWQLQSGRDILAGFQKLAVSFWKSQMEQTLQAKNQQVEAALAKAEYRARHDPMTDLPNRRGFEVYMDDLKKRSTRDATAWLCHVDTDRFKTINDTMGHLAGDEVLKHIAGVLTLHTKDKGHAARIGGDEFVAVLTGIDSKEAVTKFCEKLSAAFTRSVFFNGLELVVSCTVGVTPFKPATETISDILSRSDLALYSGKTTANGKHCFFHKDMEATAIRRRQLEKEIETAIETDAFVPFFQPQYDASTGGLVGFEVLARWQHDRAGTLMPDYFLDTAERMGVVETIDRAMLIKSISILKRWQKKFEIDPSLSVNISADRLVSANLLQDLSDLGQAAKNVNLELLETIYLDNHAIDHEGIVQDLRKTGVGIEIDDFGTGHTSILSVLAVKPDRLKIDRRLIQPIVAEKSARNLIKSILQIGDQLGISAVAEGVETKDHMNILADMNCERLQGYFFSKPDTADNIERRLLDHDA